MFPNIFAFENHLIPIYQANNKFLCNGMIISDVYKVNNIKGKKRYSFNFIPSNFIKLLKKHNVLDYHDIISFIFCARESRKIKGRFYSYNKLWSKPIKCTRYISLSKFLKRRTLRDG